MSDSGLPPPPPPPGGGGSFPPPPPPPPGGYAIPAQAHYRPDPAGFGQRFLALCIDGFVVGAPVVLAFIIAAATVPTELTTCTTTSGQLAICERPDSAGIAVLLLIALISIVGFLAYWGHMEGRVGQTVGKRAMGIRTVRAGTDQPIGFGRAIGRLFARYASSFICYLGYLWMLWDQDSQTWHDKIVDSQVVHARRPS